MIIDCVSDTHGNFPELSGGDLLIVAGDLTASDSIYEHAEFQGWISQQNYRKKIFIGGNHDNNLDSDFSWDNENTAEYLCDSGTEFHYYDDKFPTEDEGFLPSGKRTLKIWGSPWTKRFPGMNPRCMAFTVDTDEELAEKWALIPSEVDILITHSPAYGLRDQVEDYMSGKIRCCGSKSLQMELFRRLRPKLFICGHIHEGYGIEAPGGIVEKCVNASHVNERYQPVNKPIRIIL